jgi:hypothetical protein
MGRATTLLTASYQLTRSVWLVFVSVSMASAALIQVRWTPVHQMRSAAMGKHARRALVSTRLLATRDKTA